MKKTIGQAPGKIILSGEYAVVFGYPGIAVPAPFTVTARWDPSPSLAPARFTLSPRERGAKNHDTPSISHSGIENEDYLHRILNEIQKYTGNLHGHLTIENTIPIGRGMGSSTALVIAIVRAICGATTPESSLRKFTLSTENTVNPGHSGLDFAVIWEGKPVKFTKADGPTPIDLDLSFLENAVLIDTGKPNETTSELVEWMRSRSDDSGVVATALQKIGSCTEHLIAGESPLVVFPDHHQAQVAIGVIPEPVQTLITDIEKMGGVAKVVGAGGRTGSAGVVLAFYEKKTNIAAIAADHNMPIIALTPTHPPYTPSNT